MVAVVGGDGPQAIGRQELGFVEELAEHPPQVLHADDAEQQPLLTWTVSEQPGLDHPLAVGDALAPSAAG